MSIIEKSGPGDKVGGYLSQPAHKTLPRGRFTGRELYGAIVRPISEHGTLTVPLKNLALAWHIGVDCIGSTISLSPSITILSPGGGIICCRGGISNEKLRPQPVKLIAIKRHNTIPTPPIHISPLSYVKAGWELGGF